MNILVLSSPGRVRGRRAIFPDVDHGGPDESMFNHNLAIVSIPEVF